MFPGSTMNNMGLGEGQLIYEPAPYSVLGPPPVMGSRSVYTTSTGHSTRDFIGNLVGSGLTVLNNFLVSRNPYALQGQLQQGQMTPEQYALYQQQQQAGLTGSFWQKIANTIGVTPDTLTLIAIGGVALWALPSFRGKK